MRLFSYIFLFLLTTWQLIAQTYPVQVVPMLTPPYSSKIADYANPMANRVQLQLITTDLSVQNRSVQLYVEIKGNGLTAASAPVLSGVSPLRINGGEILRLTNAELASYFQLRNLQGITSQQYTSALPDGMYSFCFRVKDVLSGRWLSQSHCAIAYLMLNDPPILNIPTDNEQVAVTDFQNIIFSWTPRQINATNITYSFELREILDPTLDPRFAFEVSRRILKEDDLRMTTFVYDVSKPNLIPGRRYAWRVRAISTGGLAENSVFKNNGYSEVHSFVYAVNCSKPLFLLSQQQGKNRTKLLWQGHTLHQKYHIQYRKKGVANAQWFEASTRNTQTLITDLEAGEYEFRVGATCETERYGINPSYVYSDIQTFEIEKTQSTTESAYNCGIVPKIAITNQKPLGSLVTNEVFVAGDFSVTILEVSGNNGIFSGKGFIKVPYLNDTKLAVEFENVKINADYQLTDGVVKTTYDSDWKGVQFAENLIGQGEKSKDIDVPFEIEKVETRNGEIVVIGKDGRKEVFPFAGNDSSVKGKVTTTTNGVTTTQEKIYHIDKDGKVSTPQAVAQGGKPTKENTNGVTKEGEATALTAKGIEVTFENTADSKYAYEVPAKAYSKDYQKMDGKYIPFKAVVKDKTEPFLAKVHITDKNISADSLIFKTDKGALIESKRIEGSDDFLLTLKGFHSFAVEQVQATIKQGKKYQIAGVFNLVHLSPKTAKVVLVPTAENLSINTDRVKAIYSKIGVTLDITWAAPFDITPYLSDGVLETKDVFGDLTDYSLSQQKIIDAYKATGKVVNDTYYVFITNAKSSTGQGGYMALGGQFGFVFDQTERTLAHELGHGIFKLAHPFKKKQQGDVPSLMDYTSDEDLLFADWKQINDPAFKVGIFQGQKDGLRVSEKYFISGHNKGIAPNGKVIVEINTTKTGYKARFGIEYGDYYIHHIQLYNDAGKPIDNELYSWNGEDFVNQTSAKTIAQTDAIELVYNTATSTVKTYVYQLVNECIYNYAEIDYTSSKGISEIEKLKWKKQYLLSAGKECIGKENLSNEGDGNGGEKTVFSYIADKKLSEKVKEKLHSIVSKNTKNSITGENHHLNTKILLSDKNVSANTAKISLRKENGKAQLYVDDKKVAIESDEIIFWIEYDSSNDKISVREVVVGDSFDEYLRKALKQWDDQLQYQQASFFGKLFYIGKDITDFHFTAFYDLFDMLGSGIGKLKIPESVWNCKANDYNPIYAEVFSYLNLSGSINLITEQIAGEEANLTKTSQASFALFCGIYNGLIDVVKTVPDLGKLLSSFGSSKGRENNSEFIQQIENIEIIDEEGNVIYSKGLGFGKLWFLFKEGISDQFSKDNPCKTGEFIGSIAGPIIVLCFGDVAASESIIAKIGSTSLKALQFCDRIADPFRYMGMSIRFIKNTSGKLVIVFRNATGKVAERLESGLYRVRVLVNNTERLEDVSENIAEELFNGRTVSIGGDTNARLAHTTEDTAEKTAKEVAEEYAKSEKLLKESVNNSEAPNALFNNKNAVNALTKARNNPILKKLGFTDKILASLRASGKGEFSYEKILDKLLSIAKKIEDNPNTTLEDFYEKVIYKLEKNSKATNSQRIGVEGVLKAVDDEFDNLLKGKIVRFENSVENIRGTKSYEDLNVEIVTFDGTKTAYRIEVKNCPTCVDTHIIRKQFIERDLFNATDISQIKWRIYGQNFTKQDFEKLLKENKEAIKSLLKNEKSKSNIEKWFDLKEGQSFISDEQIKIFSNTYYSKIFN